MVEGFKEDEKGQRRALQKKVCPVIGLFFLSLLCL